MIHPLHDYVLLEKVPQEKKVGSIVLTTEKKVGNVATVIALGEGAVNEEGKHIPFSVKIGDKVIYRDYSGTDYEEEGRKFILIKEEDILGILD
ncbi:MAG: co-chaperone GroES [Candidatus Enteromonas sp.]|nr:co-chaperone GroES [Candidatus Enteromonas sp.]MDY6093536.1 co-chaperone GroES [Candidatus Enteromonas sp.]